MSGLLPTTVFVPNPHFEEEVQKSPELQDAVTIAAEEVATVAKSLAPVLTGALRDSITVVHEIGGDGSAEATVEATVPYAAYVEYGTSNASAQPYLRPAADAVIGRGGV